MRKGGFLLIACKHVTAAFRIISPRPQFVLHTMIWHLEIKVYKTAILYVSFYECGTCSLTWNEARALTVSERGR
jgi:hypothetical protein